MLLLLSGHPSYNEQELLKELQRGDRAANEQVYQLLIGQLCYFIETMTGDTIATEDIAAESLVKGFARVKEFATLANFKFFVFGVARNAATDYARAAQRHRKAHEEIRYLSGEAGTDSERAFIESEVLQVIYREIGSLPPQVREVIELNILRGLPLAEVAARMNIAYKTVQNHKARAIRLLRVSLIKNKLLVQPMLIAALQLLAAYSEKK